MTAIQSVRFPMTERMRSLLLDCIDSLESIGGWYSIHGDIRVGRTSIVQAKLLNCLPEIMLGDDDSPWVNVLGHHFQIKRVPPTHPPMWTIREATMLETMEGEISRLLARYYDDA